MRLKLFFPILLLCISVSLSAQTEYKIQRLRVSASGGLGYMVAEGSTGGAGSIVNVEKITQFNNDLRWTPSLNADVHYLFKDWGLGVKYIFNTSSATATDLIVDVQDNQHYLVGDASEKMYVNYVGLSVSGQYRFGKEERFQFFASSSGGYARLRDESHVLMRNMLITGNAYGVNYEMGFEYFLNSNFSWGLNTAFFWTNFYTVKVTDGISTEVKKLGREDNINVSNVNLTTGLRYYINK